MRFLLGVNIGTTVATTLCDAGHDVMRAALHHAQESDGAVLAHAVRQNRILVTCDGDFGDLIYRQGADVPPAVIYIRFEPDAIADLVPRLMDILDFTRLDGHITVIGPEHDRRRPFPVRSTDHG